MMPFAGLKPVPFSDMIAAAGEATPLKEAGDILVKEGTS
jgi:hypothetical protein